MKLFILLITLLSTFSCKKPQNQGEKSRVVHKDVLQEANRSDVNRERDEISAYIKNHGWEMKETGTGLRYMIIREGEGEKIKHGNAALVEYVVKLTDGKTIYKSNGTPKQVMVGRDNVESGLHEALTLLKKGSKARFVLPSYLAHGLTGDGDKIPPRATVIYEIEVKDVR